MQENPRIDPVGAARPLPSGAARLRQRRAKRDDIGPKSRWLILAMIVVFVIGLFLSGEGRDFVRYLYSPVAIIIVIFAIIEYIALKGRDRTRIYRLELEQARERRRQDSAFLEQMAERLARVEANLRSRRAAPASPPLEGDPTEADDLRDLRRQIQNRL